MNPTTTAGRFLIVEDRIAVLMMDERACGNFEAVRQMRMRQGSKKLYKRGRHAFEKSRGVRNALLHHASIKTRSQDRHRLV